MTAAQRSVVVERLKATLLPVLNDSEACGVLCFDLVLSALDQHIKDLDDAKKVARLLRDYAKHIVLMRS